ncbi:MAG: ABC transporter substrate-binding protein, partial [Chloroflexota bacterium]
RPGPVATPTPTTVAPPTATPTPSEQPKRGGSVKFIEAAQTQTYDLYLECCPTMQLELSKLYNGLLINYDGEKVECDICQEWRLENNGKTMVFILRQGIKFHNGKELTSADVKYSIRMITGQVDGIVSPRVGVMKEYIDTVETPSKYEVRLNLVRPSALMPKILTVAGSVIVPEGTTRDDLKKGALGTGPFVQKSIVPGATRTLERNPNYFKAGQPYLDAVTIDIVADATSRNAAFLIGKYPYLATSYGYAAEFWPQLTKLKNEGKVFTAIEYGGEGPHGVWMNPKKPPFNDIKVRQAINLALNRVEMGQASYREYAVEQLLFYSEKQEYGTPKDKIWNVQAGWGTGAKKAEEQAQAKKLLADAGFPSGFKLNQFVNTTTISGFGYTAGHLEAQSQFKKYLNIETTLDYATSSADFVARTSNHDFFFMFYIYYPTTYDPDEVIGQYWVCGGARNQEDYCNPEVDKLFLQMSGELDPAKRKDVFLKIQDIILNKDVGYAPTPTTDRYVFVWNWLGGFTKPRNIWFSNGNVRSDRVWLKQQ